MEDKRRKKTDIPLNFYIVYLWVSDEEEQTPYTGVEISLTPYFEIQAYICTYTM